MRKILFLLLLTIAIGIGAGNANAFSTVKLADSAGNFVANNVLTMDWSSSGSGVGQGIGPFGQPLAVGQTFTFSYQAELVGVTDSIGATVAFPNLSSTFEYTIAAQFTEQVAFLAGPTAIFTTAGVGSWYMYFDGTPNADVPSGVGFDDGIVVASGTINPGQFSSFTELPGNIGLGSALLEGLATYVDTNYIMNMPGQFPIFDFRYQGEIGYPPLESTTSAFFGSRAGEGNFGAFNVAANDLLLKVDGSSKFSGQPIPEPSTMILLGIGLLGIAGYSRKKMK